MTDNNRLFTDKELEEFTKGHIELALEALENNDVEKAKYWCHRNEETKHWIHDHFVYWVTSLLSHIQRTYGEDATIEALSKSYFLPMLEFERKRKELGIKKYMEMWVDGILRHHGMMPGLKIEEDNEKFIITLGRCGSGGFMIDRGDYGGSCGFTRLTKARPETWGEENVPVYCAHCTQVEIWSNLLGGAKAQTIVVAKSKLLPGEPCVLHFYKDPKYVPEKFIARVGLDKTHWHEEIRVKHID